MNTLAIDLPPIEAEKTVEVTVRVNGNTHFLNYKVELFRWEDWRQSTEPRAVTLKRIIDHYDNQWSLMQIGTPTDAFVPVMFRKVQSTL